MTTLVLVTVAMWVQFIRDLVPLSISIITATSSCSLVVSSCVIDQLECVIQPILFLIVREAFEPDAVYVAGVWMTWHKLCDDTVECVRCGQGGYRGCVRQC